VSDLLIADENIDDIAAARFVVGVVAFDAEQNRRVKWRIMAKMQMEGTVIAVRLKYQAYLSN
jgi:hypothetical protein